MAQYGPQHRETPLFGVFGPFRTPDGRKSFPSPPDRQDPVNRELRAQEAEPSKVAVVRNTQVAQHKRGSNEPNNSRKISPKKSWSRETCAKPSPNSVATFFFDSGTPVALGPRKGPAGLACCCCCLLDAHAPPLWSNDLIGRLKYYVLQLGDPNPNLGPAGPGGPAAGEGLVRHAGAGPGGAAAGHRRAVPPAGPAGRGLDHQPQRQRLCLRRDPRRAAGEARAADADQGYPQYPVYPLYPYYPLYP